MDTDPARRLLQHLIRASGAEPFGPAPPSLPFDGADLSLEALTRSGVLTEPFPPWWDAASSRIRLASADLRGCSLRAAVLTTLACGEIDFSGADLANARLQGAMLGGAVFDEALLEDADFSQAHLRFARFSGAVLESTTFERADLRGATFTAAQTDHADFGHADLEEANFRGVSGTYINFQHARLVLTDFSGASLRSADFRGAVLRNAKLDDVDLQGAELSGVDLTSCSINRVCLADARLDYTLFHRDQIGARLREELDGKYELARRAYLSLERNFLDIGDPDAASWAYGRRRRAGKMHARQQLAVNFRKRQVRKGLVNLFDYASDAAVELICGYGESVSRVLLSQFVVFCAFMSWYAITGAVAKDVGDGGMRVPTTETLDLLLFSLTAMVAPGGTPENLHPASSLALVVTLLQSFVSIFLVGLLGFVAGNRIRR